MASAPGNLPAGAYTGHVAVTAAGAAGSPAVVTVTLDVEASAGGFKIFLPLIRR
jgi:hypothetical protein